MDRVRHFGLPLLAKELVEMSARPRTYLVRVAYAAVLLLISWLILFFSIPFGAATPLDVLGRGQVVMAGVIYLQNLLLQLVLPAIACGVFTVEKERNTLSLLFLTRLGPWTIVFEKLLSRILLACCFLMISLPVVSFCYALGGITLDDLSAQLLGQLISVVLIVAVSVLCSSYFRTTSAALMGTYTLIYFLRVMVQGMVLNALSGRAVSLTEIMFGVLFTGNAMMINDATFITWASNSRFLTMAMFGIPWLACSAVCVVLARWFLVRRAFVTPRNPLREFFKRLDGLFDRANRNSLTRGMVLIRPNARLPGMAPVAWRETTTRSLGQARYLIRMLLALELPVLFLLLTYLLYDDQRAVVSSTLLVQILLWIAMTLVVCVLSAGLISGERGRQSLEVLLATPLSSREIVSQKLAGVFRLIWILEAPLWTCLAFRFLVDGDFLYLLSHAFMLLVYPRAVAWMSMWYGMTSKTAIVAVVKSLLAVLWRCLGPIVIIYVFVMFLVMGNGFIGSEEGFEEVLAFMSLISPVALFFISEMQKEFVGGDYPWAWHPEIGLILSVVIHGGLMAWAWHRCLARADVLLGRKQSKFESARQQAE